MKNRRSFIAQLSAVAASASALSPVAVRAQAKLTPIRICGSAADDMSAALYAQQTKMFEKAGLEVTIDKINSGSAAAAAIASGTYDIAKSSITSIFDAHVKGIPFTVLAPAALYDKTNPYGGMVIAGNSTLKLDKDAEGQTLGVASLTSIGRVAAAAWIEQHGGDLSKVKFVEIPIPTVTAALDQKRIAAGECGQPALANAVASGYKYIPAYDAIAPRFALSVYYTTRDFSAKNPEALRTFVRVLYDAGKQVMAKPQIAAKMTADFIGIPIEVLEKMPHVILGTELVLSQVQSTIDAAAKYGTLKASFPAREIIDATALSR
jgi:NitT/TauT family transport system substrate-binding protein